MRVTVCWRELLYDDDTGGQWGNDNLFFYVVFMYLYMPHTSYVCVLMCVLRLQLGICNIIQSRDSF
jgi:hypothetical protein